MRTLALVSSWTMPYGPAKPRLVATRQPAHMTGFRRSLRAPFGLSALTALLVLAACSGSDTDSDAATATDTTATGDTGTNTVSDDTVLVVPQGTGLELLHLDGSVAFSRTWTELVGDCGRCGGEGASDDGDGLLVSFTNGGQRREGGIARIDADWMFDFRLDGFAFPHDAERDPADGTVFLAATSDDRITWLAGDGSSDAEVRSLSDLDSGFAGNPNGMDRFDYDGRSYLLVTHRGGSGGVPGGGAAGSLTLWDITTKDRPEFTWAFPPSGSLDTPHGALLRQWEGQWWLLWAHTYGADDGGSVGLAVTDDPTTLPTYVADLVPDNDVGPFGFLRGVELTSDGRLFLTDSNNGTGGGSTGRLIEAVMPSLSPTGAVGSVADQEQVSLGAATAVASNLSSPFEAWLWNWSP